MANAVHTFPLLPIECKRLPTPKGTDRDDREYLFISTASTGGIQRFKKGHHCSRHNLGAMIGYVRDQNKSFWNNRVAEWINDLVSAGATGWSANDHLQLQRSERDDGGIYLVPTLGGQPRLLARRGRSPHFSPDGSQILYFEGTLASSDQLDSGKIFVVPTAGGEPRQLQPGVAWGCYPIWSPDGKSVLFFGTAAPKEPPGNAVRLVVIPVDGARAVRTGGNDLLRRQHFESADKRYSFSGSPKIGAWFFRSRRVQPQVGG